MPRPPTPLCPSCKYAVYSDRDRRHLATGESACPDVDRRICKACRRGDHDGCDSLDVIGNHDYCGPMPVCACLGSATHPV